MVISRSKPRSFEGLTNVSVKNYQNLPKLENPAGYVYVIKDNRYHKFKIGRTINPKSRLRDIQRNEVGQLEYIHLVRTEDAKATEKNLHERYAKFRIRKDREWFELGESQLQDILNLVSPKQSKRGDSSNSVGVSASLLLSLFVVIGITAHFARTPNSPRANQAFLPRDTYTPPSYTKRPTATRTVTATQTASPTSTHTASATESNTVIRTSTATATMIASPTPTLNPLYVRNFQDGSSARVRSCAGTERCRIIGGIRSGDIIRSPEYIIGEAVNGNKQWIRFRFNDDYGYIHSSLVTDNSSRR